MEVEVGVERGALVLWVINRTHRHASIGIAGGGVPPKTWLPAPGGASVPVFRQGRAIRLRERSCCSDASSFFTCGALLL